MNFYIHGHNIFSIVIITFLVSAILIPFIKVLAVHINAIDIPNERKVHGKPMPRLGGLAIFFSFLMGYILYAPESTQMLSVIIGGFIIIIVGIADDIKPLRARYKLLLQIIASSVVVFYGELVLQDINVLGLVLNFGTPVNHIFTILFIVAIMNAINFIDGLDGLAAGVSSIYFLTIGIIALILNKLGGLDIILSFIMLGATLGFLLYNFNPASIFMGDTGSLFLGFIISVIALLGFKTATITSLIIPLLILAVPIFDTILAIFRRLIKGESIGYPDKEHLHHQLLNMKFSPKKIVLIIYFFTALFAGVSIFYVLEKNQLAILIYIVLMIVLFVFVLKTNILFAHKKKVLNNDKKNI